MLLALRLTLLVTAPLWGPVALVLGLARICGDGLLFVAEGYLGRPVVLPPGARLVLYPLALLLFPLAITLETAVSLLLHLGALPGRLLGGDGGPRWLRALLAPLVLVSAPIWVPALSIIWALRRLVFDLAVVRMSDLLRGQAIRSPSRGRFETFVALRYMRGRKASAGVSVVTGLTIGGVTLGVWSLVVVLSVMAGFEQDLQDKILGANSHVVVLSYTQHLENWEQVSEKVRGVEGVTGVTPFAYTEYMLRSKHTVIGAIFKGIHAETVGEVTNLLDNLKQGTRGRVNGRDDAQLLVDSMDNPPPVPSELMNDSDRTRQSMPGMIIGQEMAATLRVAVGDTVQAVSPSSEPGPLGAMQARVVPFRVVGVFHSGMYEYDTKFTYASLEGARRFLGAGHRVTGLEVKVDDIYDAPAIADEIGELLQYPHWTRDWQKMNEPLFAALRLEKVVMGIILTFIVAVACMNIISTLIMLVVEKRREIAIMKAMGAGRLDIMKLFMVDGLLVGFIGTVLGLCLGLATCGALKRWQFIKLESDVYYVDTLPVEISAGLVATVALIAVATAFVATLFPSWEGSSLDPVEGLRDA